MSIFIKIKNTISNAFSFDKLAENAIGYTETKLELLRLEFEKKLQELTVKFITGAIIGTLFILMVIFATLGIIHIINYFFEQENIGYWIMGGFYTILFFTIFFLKDSDFFNNFIRNLVNPKNNDNH